MYRGYKVINLLIIYTLTAPRRINCCTTHLHSDERMINKRSNFVEKKDKYTIKMALQ